MSIKATARRIGALIARHEPAATSVAFFVGAACLYVMRGLNLKLPRDNAIYTYWGREILEGVPPYVIFHDKTLQAMAVHLPDSLETFALLPGVGERKLEKYGQAFLDVIRDYDASLSA